MNSNHARVERFSVAEYRGLLLALKEMGRPFLGFFEAEELGVLLRLDVDYDLGWAARLAAVNGEMGAVATFFVQVASPAYNALSPEGVRALKMIAGAGHRIGLHYHHQGGPLDVERMRMQYEVLRAVVGEVAPVVAWHNPEGDLSGLNAAALQAGFASTYSQRFFGPDRYVSDSNCRKGPREILEFVASHRATTVQLLLHPLIWCLGGNSMADVLDRAFRAKLEQLADSFSQNRLWQEGLGRRMLDGIRSSWPEVGQ